MGGESQSIGEKMAALRKTSIVLGEAPWDLKSRENRKTNWTQAMTPSRQVAETSAAAMPPKYTTQKVESEMKARYQVPGFVQPKA
ncbi:unnamed protein product [Amoebophrya sp. A25]|nr:unnamed protein product [Amoebophrya sp. A25]|eukprot:GSA25T00022952001.1